MLERRGVISGYEGSKPRQVLITEGDVPRVLAALGRAGRAGRRAGGRGRGERRTASSLSPLPMPEIGATLREARMRRRIDIDEVEAATKIRAKYLRALENEEWDLLPGPDLRQVVPAHVRGVPRARLAAARRGVQAALRAAGDAGPDAVLRRTSGATGRRRRARLAAIAPVR